MTRTNEAEETRTAGVTAVPAADAQPIYPHTMRLQRFLARAGVASRRGSEDLMTAGRVTVNGQVATELGTKVDVDRDHIEVDGMPVKLNQGAVYLMLYKPTGYLTTMSDPQERPCVADLVPRDRFPGLFPVGRLDRDTTGLLLFTTDGDLSQDLLHPSKHVYKTYQALVDGHLTDRDLEPLRRGIELDDGLCQPAICRVITAREAEAVAPQGVKPGTTAVEVIIREGRKNQVKRMLSKIDHPGRSVCIAVTLPALSSRTWPRVRGASSPTARCRSSRLAVSRPSRPPPSAPPRPRPTPQAARATTAATAPHPSATPTVSATPARQTTKPHHSHIIPARQPPKGSIA